MRVREERRHELTWSQRGRIGAGESRSLDKISHERLFVGVEFLRPAFFQHDYAVADLLRIRAVLAQSQGHGSSLKAPVSSLVGAINQKTGLLAFYRQEERRRCVDAFGFTTTRIIAAGFNVIDPEVKAGLVGLATEEVQILLAHKVFSSIQR